MARYKPKLETMKSAQIIIFVVLWTILFFTSIWFFIDNKILLYLCLIFLVIIGGVWIKNIVKQRVITDKNAETKNLLKASLNIFAVSVVLIALIISLVVVWGLWI